VSASVPENDKTRRSGSSLAKRGTTPQVTDNLPKGTTAGHPRLDRFVGSYAEGAGLEPDPIGWSDIVIVDHLETPVSFTLLRATLAVKSRGERVKTQLAHKFFTPV
jgi:hypothetical protein